MESRHWTPKIVEIGDQIAALSVAQATGLVKYLEAIHGVKAFGLPTQPTVPEPDIIVRQPKPEPTAFNVVLEGFEAAKKIGVIKAVREIAGLGIKEAKDFVEAGPKVIQENLPQAEAEKLKARLEVAGAQAIIKPVVE